MPSTNAQKKLRSRLTPVNSSTPTISHYFFYPRIFRATCEKFLKEIGDAAKIRACLDKEHAEMLKMEQCVKDKVGELGYD